MAGSLLSIGFKELLNGFFLIPVHGELLFTRPLAHNIPLYTLQNEKDRAPKWALLVCSRL